VSVVIDLSHAAHQTKVEYLRTVLPALAMLRRHAGLPHRIVVDEAHYFLHGESARLLDLDLNGYTLVSYRASRLPATVLSASQAVIVTRESDPHEVRSLFTLCGACQGQRDESEWESLLGGLTLGEAVVLPVTDEAQGDVRRIHLAPRLTPHVRHQAKYVDIPVVDSRAFAFWQNGTATPRRARTLREFVDVLEHSSLEALDGHLRRGDFSRWIADVFGDYPLANSVRQLEADYRSGQARDLPTVLTQAIRSRYEFLKPVGSVSG
jgi:hypothetical protein